MWISSYKYERIIERLEALEKAADVPFYSAPVGRLVWLLLDHLGLHYTRTNPSDALVKKGGPERG